MERKKNDALVRRENVKQRNILKKQIEDQNISKNLLYNKAESSYMENLMTEIVDTNNRAQQATIANRELFVSQMLKIMENDEKL